jgi:hypothetical protein
VASSEREALLHLVEELSEDEVRDVLALVRQRGSSNRPKRPAWVGMLHEGPDFAKQAKETLRTELGGSR